MRNIRLALVGLVAGCGVVALLTVPSAQVPAAVPLPGVEPLHESGQDVTPAFEGWFKNPDGTFEMQFGYHNRNTKEEVDIPIGPNNKFEPGPADQGQPTHFMPRRGWGNFTVTVPKDFGTKKLTWTLVHAGRTNAVPGSLDARWEIDALKEATVGNTPPTIKFTATGPGGQGPKGFTSPTTLNATVGAPLTLEAWASDDGKNRSRNYRGPLVNLTWMKYRGPGTVTFAKAKPEADKETGMATTTATFSAPGDYTLRLQVNDSSGDGGGGFQCCWTNGFVKVSVKDAGTR